MKVTLSEFRKNLSKYVVQDCEKIEIMLYNKVVGVYKCCTTFEPKDKNVVQQNTKCCTTNEVKQQNVVQDEPDAFLVELKRANAQKKVDKIETKSIEPKAVLSNAEKMSKAREVLKSLEVKSVPTEEVRYIWEDGECKPLTLNQWLKGGRKEAGFYKLSIQERI